MKIQEETSRYKVTDLQDTIKGTNTNKGIKRFVLLNNIYKISACGDY